MNGIPELCSEKGGFRVLCLESRIKLRELVAENPVKSRRNFNFFSYEKVLFINLSGSYGILLQ